MILIIMMREGGGKRQRERCLKIRNILITVGQNVKKEEGLGPSPGHSDIESILKTRKHAPVGQIYMVNMLIFS